MIMGILAPDSGEISFRFNKKNTAMDKSRIGYLPEERGLYDDAKVLDTLIYLADLKGTTVQKLDILRWNGCKGFQGEGGFVDEQDIF